ncbi:hypothetical protein [Paenibacillus sp. Soil724D2]|uniref:hypothetical protein n=1 Tax=Paenibacillus sp. (strain Soil724D2) TaxID=1736392 RepID=UPI000713717C|nr:hypothetical protein [Paenibacillus sp. Soil724D2]KRE48378.1 hypothetical protein ASG85_05085 [Paenibacillus sp. Soil724D2]
MDKLEKICKLSRHTIYSQILQLGKKVEKRGAKFENIHRYHFQITYFDQVVDIKLNLYDIEFFVLLNSNVKKATTTIHDIEKWLNAHLFRDDSVIS